MLRFYFKVFDYDRFFTDDFMGSAKIDISPVKWFQSVEKIVELFDDALPEEELGTISLTITVLPITSDEKNEICNRSSDPKWIEQFDLHIYELGSETLEVMCQDKRSNSLIGRYDHSRWKYAEKSLEKTFNHNNAGIMLRNRLSLNLGVLNQYVIFL
uniref:C2 domain-containing protein n=1 Tax=Angiostrongylus cantonensis TaxID=6313 RepID=A0A0K0D5N0_ANGCA